MNKLRNRLKTGVMSLMVAAGAVLPSVTPIMAQDDSDPKLTVTVEGSGTVQISEKDSEKFQFALPNSPFEELIKAGTTVELECTGDDQLIKELAVDDEIQNLEYGQPTLDFDFTMPDKDTDIRVVFENAVIRKEKTTKTAESKPVESESVEIKDEPAEVESKNEEDTSSETTIERRKRIAKELGVEDEINEQGLLEKDFWQTHDIRLLNLEGWNELYTDTDTITIEGDAAMVKERAGSVRVQSVFSTPFVPMPWGGTMSEGYWTMSNGETAFCGNGDLAPPQPSTNPTTNPVLVTNEAVRKAIYYGYRGPDNRYKEAGFTEYQQIIMTNDILSYANSGTCVGIIALNGYHWNAPGGMKSWYENIQKMPTPPSNYKVYKISFENSSVPSYWTGTYKSQDLFYGRFEQETGHLAVVKRSSNTAISNNNDCYDLNTAEYTLYSDAACTKAVKVFKLTSGDDNKAWDGPYEFALGTYYLKETKAATGYALDPTVHTVKVEANGQTHPSGFTNWKDIEMKNIPQSDTVDVLLKKVDADTEQSVPQGGASLADAQFTFKFYAGSNPNLDGNPTRTWVMKTDKDGYVKLADTYKVSGDAFYTNSNGRPTLPLGTLTVQETKAPAGYYINNQIHTIKITSKGQTENIQTYNAPIVKEQVNDLILTKVQLGSNVAIPGTVFTWTKPDGKTEDIKTDGYGQIKMTGLATGVHKLKEKSVMTGYELNQNEFSFEVTATGITAKTDTTGKNMTFIAGTTTGKSYQLTVEDGLENYDLKLIKVNEHDKMLPGAEFTLYSDAACTKVVAKKTTDASGILIFDEIKDRTDYWFKETKAPEGYRIPVDSNGNVHVYKLRAESTPAKGQFDFYVDGTKYTANNTSGSVHLEDVNGDKVVSITVVNYTTSKLPETGSNGTLLLLGTGLAAVAGYFALNRKRKTNR